MGSFLSDTFFKSFSSKYVYVEAATTMTFFIEKSPFAPYHPKSISTLPLFGPLEVYKWFFHISSQIESQKNCIYLFQQNPIFNSLHLRSPVHVVPPLYSLPYILYKFSHPQLGKVTTQSNDYQLQLVTDKKNFSYNYRYVTEIFFPVTVTITQQ